MLDRLGRLAGPSELRMAVRDLCLPFGTIIKIDVVADGKDAFICFVELSSIGENAAMCRLLGGFPFGQGVGFRIPMKRSTGGPN